MQPTSLVRLLAKPPASPPAGSPAAAPQPAATGAAPDATAPQPARHVSSASTGGRQPADRLLLPLPQPGRAHVVLPRRLRATSTATGVIRPTIPIFGPLNVTYAREVLALVAPLDKSKLRSPLPAAFRFTGGELALQLSPELVPRGSVTFSVGPEAKPVILGDARRHGDRRGAGRHGHAHPGRAHPRPSAAVRARSTWRSDTGWSGKINATSSSIPDVTADVELGFRDRTAAGSSRTPRAGWSPDVRNAELRLGAAWDGQAVSYSGGVVVERPCPMVESVRLRGSYGDRGLCLEGDAPIRWRNHRRRASTSSTPDARTSRRAASPAAPRSPIRTAKAEGA